MPRPVTIPRIDQLEVKYVWVEFFIYIVCHIRSLPDTRITKFNADFRLDTQPRLKNVFEWNDAKK